MKYLLALFFLLFLLQGGVAQKFAGSASAASSIISKSASTKTTSGFAQSTGVKIHYLTFGEGQPVLIINGGPGFSSEGFVPLAKELSKGYQTIIYDQRGTGLSKLTVVDSTTITMDLMTEDIEALRQYLGIENWVVMGHSFGGMMANYYTAEHPDRVKALIASSSGGIDLGLLDGLDIRSKLSQTERDSLSYWSVQIQKGDTTHHARLQRGKYLAPAYLYHREHIPVVAERLTQGDMILNGLVWEDLRRIDYDVSEELTDFKKPVLIIQGAEDVLEKSVAKKAKEVFSNSKLVVLQECGHYGWLDQPDKYYGEIREFLKSLL